MTCSHCSFSSSPGETHRLSPEEVKHAIEEATSIAPGTIGLSKISKPDIRFSGGEPFIHYADLLESIHHARKCGARIIGVTTNASWGTTLPAARKKIKELTEAGLNDIRLSFDEFHGTFEGRTAFRNAFAAAVEKKINVGIKIVVHKGSKRAADVLRTLEDLTRDVIFFIEELSLLPLGRAAELPGNIFFKSPGIPTEPCDMLGTFALDVKGNVYPCCVPGWPKPLHLGNIRDSDSPPLSELIRRTDSNDILNVIQDIGPAYFIPYLEKLGMSFTPGSFINKCHLCHYILTAAAKNKDIMSSINKAATAYKKKQESVRSSLNTLENLLQDHGWIIKNEQ